MHAESTTVSRCCWAASGVPHRVHFPRKAWAASSPLASSSAWYAGISVVSDDAPELLCQKVPRTFQRISRRASAILPWAPRSESSMSRLHHSRVTSICFAKIVFWGVKNCRQLCRFIFLGFGASKVIFRGVRAIGQSPGGSFFTRFRYGALPGSPPPPPPQR